MPTHITQLRNLGPVMQRYLAEIGILDAESLRTKGYMQAYLSIAARHPHMLNRMALYALYGALHDVDCIKLPESIKQQLNEELASAKEAYDKMPIPLHILP